MLTLTENAQKAIEGFIQTAEDPVKGLRIEVKGGGCSGYQYAMALVENPNGDDVIVPCGGTEVYMDPATAPLMDGTTVDFVETLEGSGFQFQNPNAQNSCGCGKSFSA